MIDLNETLSSPAPALFRFSAFETDGDGQGGAPRIDPETLWRQPPSPPPHGQSGILVSRWKEDGAGPRRHSAPAIPDFVTIGIALRQADLTLWIGERCVHDGRIAPGMVQVTGAGLPARVELRGACDVLHLFVPAALVAEVGDNGDGGAGAFGSPAPDQPIERLAWSLLRVGDLDPGTASLYFDGITLAIVARLLNSRASGSAPGAPRREGLVKWRLRKVLDFVEANLAEPLSLETLARCAGLSRMHFAAQFRTATGIRPHEYLVRRRIERAQEMLLGTPLSLVEIALGVGFQTQAHFTTVFRRLLGETPGRWRHLHRS